MQGPRRRGDWDDVAVAVLCELEEQKQVFTAAGADPLPLPAGPAAWRAFLNGSGLRKGDSPRVGSSARWESWRSRQFLPPVPADFPVSRLSSPARSPTEPHLEGTVYEPQEVDRPGD